MVVDGEHGLQVQEQEEFEAVIVGDDDKDNEEHEQEHIQAVDEEKEQGNI